MGLLKKIINFGIISFLAFALVSCGKEPEITPDMLDGDVIFDASLYNKEAFLTSYSNPTPTEDEKNRPVLIACHGYSATTFEWNEFRTWANANANEVFVSQVLLGGHGRTYEDFKKATWEDWQFAIKEEYERLEKAGYKNIHFAGSSTSCALLLKLVADDFFNGKTTPKNIFLIDPIVISSNKTLTMVKLLGPMLGYLEVENIGDEKKYWYTFRPQESLKQLQEVITYLRKDLQKGFLMPEGCDLKVYKSERDAVADPASVVLIRKGVKTHEGNFVDISMIDSDIHVYTRLDLRENVTDKDLANKEATFKDMLLRIRN